MTSVAVLQARTSSTRLPAKVLLPVLGIPVVALAAMRAANTGRKVIVATSSDSSDDYLACVVRDSGIKCFRGSLQDALDRFIQALREYTDDTIVFRLTADNVFPDGKLLDEMEAEFLGRQLEYLACNGEPSGLPYGVSVEVTRLGHLREAARSTIDSYDREHVTSAIIRKFGAVYFCKYASAGNGSYRCTIDCLDDYLAVLDAFSGVDDAITCPLDHLIDRLVNTCRLNVAAKPASRLVLGTAQMGRNYGIANATGQPSRSQSEALIKTAILNGVRHLDTARDYGESEATIGNVWGAGWAGRAKVITKLSPLLHCAHDESPKTIQAYVDASVYRSCALLQTTRLDVLMLHRVCHLDQWKGSAWSRLLELREEGVIKVLGASVQSQHELLRVLEVEDIQYIQLPFNLVDWRWDFHVERIHRAKCTRPITIHARSCLLQGLLACQDSEAWSKANVSSGDGIREWLQAQVRAFHRRNVVDLCIAYANAQPWIDGITLGVETMSQLREIIGLCSAPPLRTEEVEAIVHSRPKLEEWTLNPSLWKTSGR